MMKMIGKVVLFVSVIGACLLYVVSSEIGKSAEKTMIVYAVQSYVVDITGKMHVVSRDGQKIVRDVRDVRVRTGKPDTKLPDGIYAQTEETPSQLLILFVESLAEKMELEFLLRRSTLIPLTPAPTPHKSTPSRRRVPSKTYTNIA